MASFLILNLAHFDPFSAFFAIMSTCFSKCCLSEFHQLIFLKGTQNFWRLATSESIFLASFLVCNGIKLCRFWIMYSKKKLFQTAVSARIISQNVEHLQSRNFVVFQKNGFLFDAKNYNFQTFRKQNSRVQVAVVSARFWRKYLQLRCC